MASDDRRAWGAPGACCEAGPPVAVHHVSASTLRGSDVTLGNAQTLTAYRVGRSDSSVAIIVAHDALGINHPTGQVRHQCDVLADAGFLVVAPDFFHASVMPAGDQKAVMRWLTSFDWAGVKQVRRMSCV